MIYNNNNNNNNIFYFISICVDKIINKLNL